MGRRDRLDEEATREPFAWNVVVGVALMGVAAAFAFDPDYPVARSRLDDPSTFSADRLAPRVLAPVGSVRCSEMRFEWSFDGERDDGLDRWCWELVVLDGDFVEVYRAPVERGQGPSDELLGVLTIGGRFHWCVTAEDRLGTLRSGLVAFEIEP